MLGFRWNPEGIVASRALADLVNPAMDVRYDWVHSLLQAGVLNAEVEALLAVAPISRRELQAFLADPAWRFPHCQEVKQRSLHRVFDERRISEDEPDKLKASCSELLGLYGILRFFFHLKLGGMPEFAACVESYDKLCDAVDLILHCKRGLASVEESVPRLQAALQLHMEAHQRVHGKGYLKPKHHWLLDVPPQILADGCVLDAFVIERMHLRVKAVAQHVKNTSVYERSVLCSLLTSTLRDHEQPFGKARLVGRTAVLPGHAPTVWVADRMEVFDYELAVDDVVFRLGAPATIVACLQQEDDMLVLVRLLSLADTVTHHCRCWVHSEVEELWDAGEAVHALAWRTKSDGQLLVVQR